MPIVSVIVPAYNAGSYIAECIDSVRVQDLIDWELIVVDDGSTDETASIVTSYVAEDSRIQYIYQEHSNAGSARNRGLGYARGDFLYFLDADDFIVPNALSVLVDGARKYKADIVVCGSHYYDDKTHAVRAIDFTMLHVDRDVPLELEALPDKPFQSFVGWPWDKLFSASFIQNKALLFQEQRSSNDASFVFLALCEAACVVCLDMDLVSHRTNNGGSLEFTRTKSWHNAIDAMSYIGGELKRRKLDGRYWASYVNWVSHFSYWSMSSLGVANVTDDVIFAFDGFQRSVGVDSTLYFDYENLSFASLSVSDRTALIRAFIIERATKNKTIDALYSSERGFMASVDDLNNTVGQLKRELDEIKMQHERLLNSKSYKLGRMLTKLPRRILRN